MGDPFPPGRDRWSERDPTPLHEPPYTRPSAREPVPAWGAESRGVEPPSVERPSRPTVARRWLILTSIALALVTIALAVTTVLWTTARRDFEESRTGLEQARAQLETVREELDGANDQIEALEGRVNGVSADLSNAKAVIVKAKICIRGIGKALRSADPEVFQAVRNDCRAVLRARAGGGGIELQ